MLLGIALMIGGPVIYLFTLDNPFLRRSGLLAVIPIVAGLIMAVLAAWRDRRLRVRVPGGVVAVMAVLFLVAFYGNPLPPAQQPDSLAAAPDFRLVDHRKNPVSLHERLADGAVLLVFYRGHW